MGHEMDQQSSPGATLPGNNGRSRDQLLGMFDLLTEDDVAILFDVKKHTLYTWRAEGRGPDFVKIGGSIYYRRQAILDWVSQNEKLGNRAA